MGWIALDIIGAAAVMVGFNRLIALLPAPPEGEEPDSFDTAW